MAWKILGSWALMTMRLAILFRELLLRMGKGKGNVFAIFFLRGLRVEGTGSGICYSGGLFLRVPLLDYLIAPGEWFLLHS